MINKCSLTLRIIRPGDRLEGCDITQQRLTMAETETNEEKGDKYLAGEIKISVGR